MDARESAQASQDNTHSSSHKSPNHTQPPQGSSTDGTTDQGTDQAKNTNLGTRSYRRRIKLSWQEDEELQDVSKKKVLKKLKVSRLFKEPHNQLNDWPHFFGSMDEYGKEMQDGLVRLWSNFIVVEALLASVAILPFASTTSLKGHTLEVYGALWMLALLSDFVGLGVTSLFLGYLLGSPGKLTWVWLCKIGALRGIPAVLILWATFMSLVAIGFSSWNLYGEWVGITCIVIEVIIVVSGIVTAHLLNKAGLDTRKGEANGPAPLKDVVVPNLDKKDEGETS